MHILSAPAKKSLFLTSLSTVFRCLFNFVIFFIFCHFKFREITLVWHVIAKVRKANHSLILTCAAGGGPWPGAISLAQPDAGALKVIIRLTTYAAGSLKVVVANVLDKEAIFWWGQHWAVHHWGSRGEKCFNRHIYKEFMIQRKEQNYCLGTQVCSHEL